MYSEDSIPYPIFAATTSIAICLNLLFIVLIITKTPTFMLNYKIYLLLYVWHSLGLELTCGLYAPSALHPYLYFYPLGIAKYFPPNISLILFGQSFYHAMSLYDCMIAMVLERYYAMKSLTREHSKIPFRVFCFLSASSFSYMIFMLLATFCNPIRSHFVAFPEENAPILRILFVDLKASIMPESVIIFRNTPANTLPAIFLIICSFLTARIIVTIIILIFTAYVSQKLMSHMSVNLQKHNRMLLWMIFLQFSGIICLLIFPMVVTLYFSLFITQPYSIISYSFATMSCFGVYDTLITITYIKPYRNGAIDMLKKLFRTKLPESNSVAIYTVGH